ncbi:MAG: RNA 2',3'-cyclic phosphodiesterase [Candidatus Binatia bacterium]
MGTEEGERVRSFIAVDLEEPVRAALRRLLDQAARLRCDVRWVRGEGLHVTLKFLGWVEALRLEQVHSTLAAAVAGRPALRVRVRGLGAFPTLRRPRILWVGLESGGLAELAACVETAMSRVGFEPEKRAFTPHITLGRVNGTRGWSRVEELFKAHMSDDFGASNVDAVTIYRSTLRPDGAVYTPLWTIPLSGNKEMPQ